jgi:hypothetical protein
MEKPSEKAGNSLKDAVGLPPGWAGVDVPASKLTTVKTSNPATLATSSRDQSSHARAALSWAPVIVILTSGMLWFDDQPFARNIFRVDDRLRRVRALFLL